MANATAIRNQIEAALTGRIPAPFAQKTVVRPELFPTRIPSIDLLLEGGIPRGQLTEIIGGSSTGRTGLAFAAIATATSKGAACAWVDVFDALDPESCAAWRVDLRRLLWLRAGVETQPDMQAAPCVLKQPKSETAARASGGGMHPRNETRGMHCAVSQLFHGKKESAPKTARQNGLLRDKTIGTPGAANRTLNHAFPQARCTESQPHRRNVEQIATDRLPSRRGEVILDRPATVVIPPVNKQSSQIRKPAEKPWSRLDQALSATDLILQAGGFGIVVLDMCDLRVEQIQRIPMATWYRFRLAAEQAQAALILLAEVSCAKSCASISLHCELVGNDIAERLNWAAAKEKPLFTSLRYRVRVDRKHVEPTVTTFQKKPAGSAHALWSSCAVSAR